MSGPNTQYDPVEVTPLKAEEVEAARDAALAAIAAAADLDALKQARIDHAGDRSPLALANREIGALPPQATQGGRPARRPGPRRGATRRSPSGTAVLEAEPRSGCSSRRPSTSPCRPTVARAAPGTRSPLMSELHRRPLRGHGLGGRRGPGARGRVAQLRRPQPRPRPPGPHHAGHVLDRPGRRPPGAAHPHLAGAGPHHADAATPPIYVDLPRPGLPHRRVRRDAHARSSTRSRAWSSTRASRWPTSRAPSTTSPQQMFGEGIATRFRPSYFPFTEPSRRGRPGLLRLPRRARPGRARAAPASGEGWIEWGGCGVVNPRVLVACGIDSERYPASPSAWASTAP